MLEAKVIAKQDIGSWLKGLGIELIAPVTVDGITRFEPVEEYSTIDLAPTPAAKGLREQFTPETETLFEYKLEGLAAEVTPVEEQSTDRLIFGARACDAAALKYTDAVFSNVQPSDSLYFARREHTAVVGLFCNSPSWSCFCTEIGDFLTNPIEMDAYLTDIGDMYYAQALTPRGEEILSAPQFHPATEADAQAVKEIQDKALAGLPAPIDHAAASESYDWDSMLWAELAEKCLGCGACSFMCPTCHCFDMQECARGSKGSRYRCWDTCQFEQFTLMGAGHNPRLTGKERTRQRVFHKFKYSVERYGMLGCVGCGRCIAVCPVNVDVRVAVAQLEQKPG